ncbi:Shiga toxin Stx1 subunit A [Escherichia coli]|uniref:rRNA N-glycosylase n=1 Tax=Escherichia coli O111 TaxID=1055535 RepID=A0AAD2ZFW7_ECOLX|nr:Shiga toxin Stx1a subunit A [Escherichia coli]ELP2902358.1 Shiga toxin Stx1 subunit A [Escherichia coli O111]AWZ53084.1 Shiga toxin Stx1 subunit A [Escherichia coli]AWZ58388.1 Shiga toxin Stx1 subunit A [Escherichia coli]EHY1675435.1 Shiga toxin Stx1 subunit A [Escherichia coli]EHY1675856.1 Shiga toxin Stx1 subunit A [Escherichia coli]
MKIIIFRVLTFFFVIFSVNVVAKEFTLDFSTAKTYVDSLNVIRSAIGTPLQTISSGGTSLLMIDSGTGDNLFAVDVRGIDPEEGRFNNLRLIVERNNLYVTGFVNRTNNVFYRFADFSHVTFPGTTAVTLSGDSSYTTLQRVAGISRTGMQINRHSLTTSYLDLMSHSGTSLTQSVARAMLRFVTVTAEALRFRQIQRGFRTTLDDLSGRSYVMTAEDVDLTLNWGRLSSVLPDYHGQDFVRVGRISFGSINAILGSVALILNCHHHASRVARMASDEFPSMCPADGRVRGITHNKILWDSSTLGAILMRRTISS